MFGNRSVKSLCTVLFEYPVTFASPRTVTSVSSNSSPRRTHRLRICSCTPSSFPIDSESCLTVCDRLGRYARVSCEKAWFMAVSRTFFKNKFRKLKKPLRRVAFFRLNVYLNAKCLPGLTGSPSTWISNRRCTPAAGFHSFCVVIASGSP